MFCLALAWAIFGHLDIVTTATGKIIPSGRTKIIQPFETGVVRAIHVHDGQTVAMGESLVYAGRISLDKTRMQVEENLVNLSPGMAVTAEIKIGPRSIISYLLSPLLRYKHESLRER